MDNLAHTLAGVALGEAGLKRITALGTATLVIGTNLPDLDAISLLTGSRIDPFMVRRGWTHGILAMIVLPFILAGAMILWDRLVRRRVAAGSDPARFDGLLLLSAIGIWSHTLLDLVNTYGVRLLMPFSDRWFYGDTLFVLDPLLWGTLAAGAFLSSRRRRRGTPSAARPARLAVAAVALYTGLMAVSSFAGRVIVERQAVAGPARKTMVAPVLLSPLRRTVVRDMGTWYETGHLEWGLRPVYTPDRIMRDGRDFPESRLAAETPTGKAFLSWARFPLFEVGVGRWQNRVTIRDLRYADTRGRDWASVSIFLPPDTSEGGSR